MTAAFDPTKHARAAAGATGGGRFVAGGGGAGAQRVVSPQQRRAQLLDAASQDEAKARQLEATLRQYLSQLSTRQAASAKARTAAKHRSATHKVPVRSSGITPKGSKSGIAAKTKTAGKTAGTTTKRTTTAQLRQEVTVLRQQVHVLQAAAKQLRREAAAVH